MIKFNIYSYISVTLRYHISESFFQFLGIPDPDINLEIGLDTHTAGW